MSRHHRHPRSLGGTNAYPNVVLVPHHLHEAWTLIFASKKDGEWLPDTPEMVCRKLNAISLLIGIKDPKGLCVAINEYWLDYRYEILYIRHETGLVEFDYVQK